MSLLKKFNEELKLNNESVVSSFGNYEFNIEDEIIAAEDEAELEETVDETEEAGDVVDEAQDVVEELEEKIEEGKAVVAAAEAAVENGGEVPTPTEENPIVDEEGEEIPAEDVAEAADKLEEDGTVPVEEVVAVQEALRNVIKRTGCEVSYIGVNLSREDIAGNTLEAYKQNVEGLKDVLGQVKDLAARAWGKILAGFKWVREKIVNVFSGKIGRLKGLSQRLVTVGGGNITADVINSDLSNYTAISNLIGKNVGKGVTDIVDSVKIAADEYSKIMMDVQKQLTELRKTAVSTNSDEDIKKQNEAVDKYSFNLFSTLITKPIKIPTVVALEKLLKDTNEVVNKEVTDGYKLKGKRLSCFNTEKNMVYGRYLLVLENTNPDSEAKFAIRDAYATGKYDTAPTGLTITASDIQAGLDAFINNGNAIVATFKKVDDALNKFYKEEELTNKDILKPVSKKLAKQAVRTIREVSKGNREIMKAFLSGFKYLNGSVYDFISVLGAKSIKLAGKNKASEETPAQ